MVEQSIRSQATEPADRRVSRDVQRRLLPRSAPRAEGYDLAGGTTLLDEGAGETVWDWIELPDGRVALLAYQVQGRGLPPSHHLAAARAVIRALARTEDPAAGILPRANRAMAAAAVDGDQFVACGMALIAGGRLEWSSAGRLPAGVIRRGGTFEELGSHGPPLGMMDGFRYGNATVAMGPGDVFLALSRASSGLLRGAADLVAQVQGRTARDVVETLHRALRRSDEGGGREISVLFVRKH